MIADRSFLSAMRRGNRGKLPGSLGPGQSDKVWQARHVWGTLDGEAVAGEAVEGDVELGTNLHHARAFDRRHTIGRRLRAARLLRRTSHRGSQREKPAGWIGDKLRLNAGLRVALEMRFGLGMVVPVFRGRRHAARPSLPERRRESSILRGANCPICSSRVSGAAPVNS